MPETSAVPKESSIAEFVELHWKNIYSLVSDGLPHEQAVKTLDINLQGRAQQIEQGTLVAGYDWQSDLKRAEYIHDFHKSWLPNVSRVRERQLSYWEDLSKRGIEFSEKVSLAGIATITALHGAVALGALNVLAKGTKDNPAQLVFAAKLAIFGALLGIFLLAIGQMAVFEFLGIASNTVRGKLFANPRHSKLRAVSRYWNRIGKRIQIGNKLIYASVFCFFLNCLIAAIILISI